MDKTIQKVLVTGGAGYIGSILTRKLLDVGYEVTVYDRIFFGIESLSDLQNYPKFKLLLYDIRDRERLDLAMAKKDAVIHLAAIVGDPACDVDPELAVEINLDAAITTAKLAKKHKINKFIFASTCSVYGASQEIVDESSKLNPLSLYAKTRLDGERAIKALQDGEFQPVILRFGTVFGLSPRMRFDLVVNLLTKKLFAEGEISIFGGEQWRPLLHVADAAKAVTLVLNADSSVVGGQVFNVGVNEQNFQLKELIPIYKKLKPRANIRLVTDMEDNRSYRVNFDKIKKILKFQSDYSVEMGIKEIYNALVAGKFKDPEDNKYYNHKAISNESKV